MYRLCNLLRSTSSSNGSSLKTADLWCHKFNADFQRRKSIDAVINLYSVEQRTTSTSCVISKKIKIIDLLVYFSDEGAMKTLLSWAHCHSKGYLKEYTSLNCRGRNVLTGHHVCFFLAPNDSLNQWAISNWKNNCTPKLHPVFYDIVNFMASTTTNNSAKQSTI